MTREAGEARMVSVTEFGLRRYLFGEQWGRRGLMGLLRPAFLTFGADPGGAGRRTPAKLPAPA